MWSRDRDLEAATATALRTCGCAHRYQPKQHTMHNRTGRSQSASRSSPTAAFSLSRPTTPSSMSQSAFSPLTEELRSLSEPHLEVSRDLYHDSSVARSTTSERASRPRATHWSRRTPEELARLARLRRSSRSPVSHYDPPGSHPGSHTGSRPGSRAGSRSGPRPSVGTGYGHSYSLPRPFDTAPTGCGRPAVAQQPQQGWVAVSSRFERARATSTAASASTAQSGAKLERSRTPSQSGATYYRSRSRNGMAGDSCSSCNSGWQHHQRPISSRTMSVESCLHLEWEDSRPPSPQHRFKSEFYLQPRCIPIGYASTVIRRKDSTWRRFVEEVRFEKCLVPDHPPRPSSQPSSPSPASAAAEPPHLLQLQLPRPRPPGRGRQHHQHRLAGTAPSCKCGSPRPRRARWVGSPTHAPCKPLPSSAARGTDQPEARAQAIPDRHDSHCRTIRLY